MQKVTLGKSDLKVSRIGLGTMGMSEFYGVTDEQQSIDTLNASLDSGINFWDTADMYGIGHNEELLSKVLKDRRNEVVLATKFGIQRTKTEMRGVNGRPEYVKEACEASLKRLKVEVIDLYYLHRVDPQTPIEDTVGAMSELVKEGKVRYLGLSEVSGETLKKAHKTHPITAVQSEYSLWSFDIEEAVLPTCRELGVSLVAYSPLGRGFLTGQFQKFEDLAEDDYRRFNPRFQGKNFEKNLKLVHEVTNLAQEKGVKPAQLALAWLISQGDDIVPIPGTKRKKYLQENIEAVNIPFNDADKNHLRELMKNIKITGTRYDERGMSLVNA
jgi:aryl-alcohol dehydrogenase-like predicted oxidoreductase